METINTDEIIKTIEAKNIKVILVNNFAESNPTDLKGSLQSFVAATEAFNESVIFIQEFSLDGDSFLHKPDGAILGEYDEPSSEDGVNLIQFLPALENYKSYIGQRSFLIFRVFYKNQAFDYWHYAEWFEAFSKLFAEAQGIFEQKEQAIKDEQAQQENAAQEEIKQRQNFLRTLLEELGDDEKFVSLRTQKAMQEYALARYPELTELPTHSLKVEISNLIARIQAKKMLQ